MNPITLIQIIGFVAAISIHAAATIWWASKMTATLEFIRLDVNRLGSELALRDQSIKALHERIDKIILEKD